ncbi:MAG: hypothetical protein QXF55_02780 [Candidatus Aenigmatarchaeota archaeon]
MLKLANPALCVALLLPQNFASSDSWAMSRKTESAYYERATGAESAAGVQVGEEACLRGSETYSASGDISQASASAPANTHMALSTPSEKASRLSSYAADFSTSFSGASQKAEDYSSYLHSLEEYCGRYGYEMPKVFGHDYASAYGAWRAVYAQWAASERAGASAQKQADTYDIVPITYSDGSVVFRDLNGHGEVAAMKMPNGFYRLSGPKELVTAIGGRGEFDTIIRHLSDGNYFNDSKS